jgi:GDP-4-dehydro-6-deoxy-D-mannose reductase
LKEKALITGAGGFIGRHLAEYVAVREGLDVLGLDLEAPRPGAPWDMCEFGECDIMDREMVFSYVARFQPDYIFHLAAQSSVRRSWDDPQLTYNIALGGQANVCEAVLATGKDTVVHVACSAEEYGPVREDDLPISEDQPLQPASPYALSKVMQDYHALFCHRAYGLKTIRTRTFNITGPGQSPQFVVSDFARQIAEAEAGKREAVMRVGNLEARRDFSDVRDLVGAYWILACRGNAGDVYNVCSGRDRSIREILDTLVSMSRVHIKVEVDPQRLRKADIPALRGDSGRMLALAGSVPGRPLEETLADVLEWWREELAGG